MKVRVERDGGMDAIVFSEGRTEIGRLWYQDGEEEPSDASLPPEAVPFAEQRRGFGLLRKFRGQQVPDSSAVVVKLHELRAEGFSTEVAHGVLRSAFAGLVQCRKARSTGTYVGVYRSAEAGLCDDDGRGPYSTVCEAHAHIVCHGTLTLARSHAAAPEGWCEQCMGLVA